MSELSGDRGPMARIPYVRSNNRHPGNAVASPQTSPFALVYSRSAGTGNGDSEGDLLGGGVQAGEGEWPTMEGAFRREGQDASGMRRGSCGVTHPSGCLSAFRRWFWIMIYKLRGVYPDAEAWVDWSEDMKEWERSRPTDPVSRRIRGDYDG
jgi:hypothetical protein